MRTKFERRPDGFLKERRAQIALQNGLANAVRTMHNLYCPCPEHVQLRRENAAHPLPPDVRETPKENPAQRCPECSGTGFAPGFDKAGRRVNVPCLRCDGSGQIGVQR